MAPAGTLMPSFRENELERLVDRCRRGDADAWAKLVNRFQGLVYSVPRRHGLDEDDCADVFQTTFQSLLRSLDRIEAANAIPRWLAVTAARESLRMVRIANRHANPDDVGLSLDEIVASEEASAESEALEAMQTEAVREMISQMAPRCRNLLHLLYFEGDIPYAEISDRLGMPIGAIGPTRARCLEKLRQLLEEANFFG